MNCSYIGIHSSFMGFVMTEKYITLESLNMNSGVNFTLKDKVNTKM